VQDGTSINSSYFLSTDPDVVTDPAVRQIVGYLPSAVDLDNRIDQTSLELRLASKDYKPGGNRSPGSAASTRCARRRRCSTTSRSSASTRHSQAAGENIEDPANMLDTFAGAWVGDSSYYSARHYDDKQNSVFGEITWHAADSLRFIAGLRYLHATQHFTREGDRYYAGGPTTALIDSTRTRRRRASRSTGMSARTTRCTRTSPRLPARRGEPACAADRARAAGPADARPAGRDSGGLQARFAVELRGRQQVALHGRQAEPHAALFYID